MIYMAITIMLIINILLISGLENQSFEGNSIDDDNTAQVAWE